MSDDEYTPTTNEVHADYVRDHTRNFDSYQVGRSLTSEREHYGAAFDRWLLQHDRQVAARALREVAERLNLHQYVPREDSTYGDLAWLCEDDECLWWDMTRALRNDIRAKAEQIEAGGAPEPDEQTIRRAARRAFFEELLRWDPSEQTKAIAEELLREDMHRVESGEGL